MGVYLLPLDLVPELPLSHKQNLLILLPLILVAALLLLPLLILVAALPLRRPSECSALEEQLANAFISLKTTSKLQKLNKHSESLN